MRSIAFLDLATNIGVAVGPPNGDPRFWTKTLPSTGPEIGKFLAAYDEWLNDLITVEGPAIVAYEAPIMAAGKTAISTARKLMGLASHTELVCHRRSIFVFEANLMTVKKQFAGSGKAQKEDMIHTANRYGWKVRTEHEADACGGWAFTVTCKAPRHAWRFTGGPLAAAPLPASVASA
jgi:crossover junction endodeoxyribonuclease RuvC